MDAPTEPGAVFARAVAVASSFLWIVGCSAGADDEVATQASSETTSPGTTSTGETTEGPSTGSEAPAEDSGGDLPDVPFCADVPSGETYGQFISGQLFDLVNERRAAGADCGAAGSFGSVAPLVWDSALECAAYVHSLQMIELDFFDHVSPDGKGLTDRLDAVGYMYSTASENIAEASEGSPDELIEVLMASDEDCRNIMSPEFTEIGIGYYADGVDRHVWTQVFAAP